MKEGTPAMMRFRKMEKQVAEPRYDRLTQTHELNGAPIDHIANFTTTAIPNYRDTA